LQKDTVASGSLRDEDIKARALGINAHARCDDRADIEYGIAESGWSGSWRCQAMGCRGRIPGFRFAGSAVAYSMPADASRAGMRTVGDDISRSCRYEQVMPVADQATKNPAFAGFFVFAMQT
jgi:hypothetical protein